MGVWGGKVQSPAAPGGGPAPQAAQAPQAPPPAAGAGGGGGDDGSGMLALATLLGSNALTGGRSSTPLQGMGANPALDVVMSSGGDTAQQALLRQQLESLNQEALTSGRRAQLAARRSAGDGRGQRMAGSPGRGFMERLTALAQPLMNFA